MDWLFEFFGKLFTTIVNEISSQYRWSNNIILNSVYCE